jgi:hypothetical protein
MKRVHVIMGESSVVKSDVIFKYNNTCFKKYNYTKGLLYFGVVKYIYVNNVLYFGRLKYNSHDVVLYFGGMKYNIVL